MTALDNLWTATAGLPSRARHAWSWARPIMVAIAATLWSWTKTAARRVGRGLGYVGRCSLSIPFAVSAMWRWRDLAASSGLGKMHRLRGTDREVPRKTPHVWGLALTPCGYRLRIRLRHAQSIDDVRNVLDKLRSGLRGDVRAQSVYRKPHLVDLVCQRRDPFTKVPRPLALSQTRFRLGRIETGADLIVDFQERPHALISGATGSGKTMFQTVLLDAIAPTDAAVALIDLKHGVAAEPYRARASIVATTQAGAADVLGDLLAIGQARAELVKASGVDSVYDLPEKPREIYVLVDEVAELAMRGSTKESKADADRAEENLLRSVQLLRAFGVHVVIAGQRFGASMGKRITDIRAQLSIRVALRCDDHETADMTVGDIARAAVDAAVDIPEWMPGVAVASGGVQRWQYVRTAYMTTDQLRKTATAHADKAVPWEDLMSETVTVPDALEDMVKE